MLPTLLSPYVYWTCAAGALLSAWRPGTGIMLFAGSVPLVLYLLEAEAFNVSVVELLALSVVLGSMVHYLSIRIGRRSSERPHGSQSWAYAAASAVIAAYLILDVSRFGPVVFRYPSVLIRTVFWADQLDPFFFVNKSVLWLTAIGLYAVTRIETREEGAARRIYYGLLFQGITFAVIFLGDLYHKGVSLSEHLLQNSQHNLPGLFTLFREHNTFAAFWLIQAVLVAGSMFARPAWQRIAAFVLFAFYSLLVLLSLSLSAIMGYAAALAAGVVVIRRGAVGSFSSFSWKKWRLPAAILVLAAGPDGYSSGDRPDPGGDDHSGQFG
jgi:hypothetical protein